MKKRLSTVWLFGLLAACTITWPPFSGDPNPTWVSGQQCGGLNVDFSFERLDGVPVYQAYITDQAGKLVPDITRVVLTLSSMDKPGNTITLAVQSSGEGRYTARAGGALTSGHWQVHMIIRRAKAPEISCQFYLRM